MSRSQIACRYTIIVLWAMCLFFSAAANAQEPVQRLISNGGYLIEDGSGEHRFREKELFVPASTIKILTSLVALESFGPNHRFVTHVFLDQQANLYIKGYGDPLLTSEVVLDIGNKLAAMGIHRLESICLDDSAFDLRGEMAGEEVSAKGYDAPNGALAVNFNAVSLLVSEQGKISSGEPQTPTLPLMQEIGKGLAPGSHRLSINALPAKPGKPAALRYVGELFSTQLKQAGITVRQHWRIMAPPPHLRPLLVQQSSAPLEEIVRNCLKYSNNFIANQLFLACGAHTFGLPATWNKARRTFAGYTTDVLHIPSNQILMQEGAGLSRQNRVSPAALVQVLNRFKPLAPLLSPRETIPLKSGTLTGVYCFAGYFPVNGELLPFAILLNQPENNRNQLLKELHVAAGAGLAAVNTHSSKR